MGHFARVEDGIVVEVIVCTGVNIAAGMFGDPSQWIRTSYNTRGGVYYTPNSNDMDPDQTRALRKNYAGIGFTYDSERDAFIPPRPYDSWVLNEETCLWEPPTPYPDDGNEYFWDEETQTWVGLPDSDPGSSEIVHEDSES